MSCHNYEQQKQSRSIITPKDKSTFPGKKLQFYHSLLKKGLSLCIMCSDQHVKYRMLHGFLLTSNLLLNYHVNQYNTHKYRFPIGLSKALAIRVLFLCSSKDSNLNYHITRSLIKVQTLWPKFYKLFHPEK